MAGISSNNLKDNKEKILSLWEQRSLKEVGSADTAPTLALRDALPLYLDHLSEALATNRKMDFKSVAKHDEKAEHIGKLHGADRAGNKNYELTEVIFEYHILREVIFQVLEVNGPLPVEQRDIVLDSIEQAVNDAAVEFSNVHKDIEQQFTMTLTHDMRNPIAAAMGNAQIIAKHSDSEETIKSASTIFRNMKRLDSMICDLLDVSRLRAGEPLSLQFIQCDLQIIIRDVVSEMSLVHGDRFILDSKETIEGKWGCDGLKRAFENLLGNAVKYSAPQTPIQVSLTRGVSVALLTVHNEGPTIPENDISLLFLQHKRLKSAKEGKQRGWGLGLALVKGVVEAHKGTARVESNAEKGTTFIIEIPFAS